MILRALVLLLVARSACGQSAVATFPFAERDGRSLLLDYYAPREGTTREATVIFLFGGSFREGTRSDSLYLPWFEQLTSAGYGVVSIDYRLGMQGERYDLSLAGLLPTARKVRRALDMAVEDLFAATRWLLRDQTEIDTRRLIVSGSSAGAIVALTAEWELCCRSPRAQVLPKGFDYSGVISFAGAILSRRGIPRYDRAPCPQLLFHGTEDTTVIYEGMRIGSVAWYGSSKLAELYRREGYPYSLYRLAGLDHRVANLMVALWPETQRFLEESVLARHCHTVDALVIDPAL